MYKETVAPITGYRLSPLRFARRRKENAAKDRKEKKIILKNDDRRRRRRCLRVCTYACACNIPVHVITSSEGLDIDG